LKKLFFGVLYVLLLSCISIYAIYKADYNWDVIGYISAVYAIESTDTNKVHQKTYESIKSSVKENNFLQLTTANKYREVLATCAKCLYQTLPFYKIKPLYVIMIYFLFKININIVFSSILISGTFYFFSCIIIYLWLLKISDNVIFTFFASILLSIVSYMINSASYCTPDSLSTFIILLAMYFLFFNKRLYIALSLMILSIFARPDNIFLLSILSGILLFDKNYSRRKVTIILSFVIGILCIFIINAWSGSYGYSTLFYHSFIERLTTPAQVNVSYEPALYIKGMLNWIFTFKNSYISIQMIILLITIYIKLISNKKLNSDFDLLILIAMGSSIVIHYIVFPLMDDRFFISQYIVINLIFVKTMRTLITSQYQVNRI